MTCTLHITVWGCLPPRFAVKIKMIAGRNVEHLRETSLGPGSWTACCGFLCFGVCGLFSGSRLSKGPGLPPSQKPKASMVLHLRTNWTHPGGNSVF